MAKIRDSSKLVSQNAPKYAEWIKFLCSIHGAAHRFNSEPRRTREAANYLIQHYDNTARMMLETVTDYSSAVAFGNSLDDLVPRFLAWLQRWVQAAAPAKSKRPAQEAHGELRKRLLRRAEHWKAEAQATCLSLNDESAEQRAARRQRVLKPLLKKAGITSDEAWAERAGPSIDRNTPRDYRNGKTKRLRRANREALAQPLGIPASELPE